MIDPVEGNEAKGAAPAAPPSAPMARALELAAKGEGYVEPNPMVGCVLVRDGVTVGEGWHEQYGGPHAEVNALHAAGERAEGATAYVTLEPCAHTGKTPPCAEALIRAKVARVVVAAEDPFPQVDGQGIAKLREAGIPCEIGDGRAAALALTAPFRKRVRTGRPWVIAKWAMTLDGKIATSTGSSRWISGPESRAAVHRLRSRADGVLVGAGTLLTDDPMLDARLPDGQSRPRVATRIVLADERPLPADRALFRSASNVAEGPVLVASPSVTVSLARGVEHWQCEPASLGERAAALLDELGQRGMTNLLVEGGAKLLGAMFDHRLVDEVEIYLAPKIVGGADAPSPVAGEGVKEMSAALQLEQLSVAQVEGDFYLRGRFAAAES